MYCLYYYLFIVFSFLCQGTEMLKFVSNIYIPLDLRCGIMSSHAYKAIVKHV